MALFYQQTALQMHFKTLLNQIYTDNGTENSKHTLLQQKNVQNDVRKISQKRREKLWN
jgi:hypothetical protein